MWKTLVFFLPIRLEVRRLPANAQEQQAGTQRTALLLLAACRKVKILRTALQVCCKAFAVTRPEMVAWEAWAATTACESEDAVRAQTKSASVAAPPGDEQAIPAWTQVHQAPRLRARSQKKPKATPKAHQKN